MFVYSEAHFDELCRAPEVEAQIGALEKNRGQAVRRFWTRLLAGVLLAATGIWALHQAGLSIWAWVVGGGVLLVGAVLACQPLVQLSEALKHPTLEALAKKGGMEYLPTGFDPPVYPEARSVLFGDSLSVEEFTDLFHGTDSAGQRFALYEASLSRRAGKNQQTVFKGQVFAFQRGRGGQGITAIVPDRGLFNFFRPAKGMERVRVESDAAFEKAFEVYSTRPAEAQQLLFDSGLRTQLLKLRERGRLFAYVGPDDALFAVTAGNRFEAGSMFSRKEGRPRVRSMFDDLCAALGTLRQLKRAIG